MNRRITNVMNSNEFRINFYSFSFTHHEVIESQKRFVSVFVSVHIRRSKIERSRFDNYDIDDVKKTKQTSIVKHSFINKFHIEQIKSTINFINNIVEININF